MRDSDRISLVVMALGIAAAILLIVAELSTIASVDVAHGSCQVINDADPSLADRCALSGLERHGGAFLLLGILTVLMAYGAGPGRSRPAAGALIAIGAVVLAIAILLDLPKTRQTGLIGESYSDAKGNAGPGFWLEIVGALAAIAAGSLRLARRPEG
jgi:hypothetical protein